jgi:hypothetical protein
MRALSPHGFNTDAAGGYGSVYYLPIRTVCLKYALGGCSSWIIIDVLRRWELVTNSLKSFCQMRLANGFSESGWVAKKESFVFVQLYIGQESEVWPQIRY